MPLESLRGELSARTRALVAEAREELRHATGVALRAEITPPAKHLRLRRVAYGVSLPFAVFRRMWRDPEARASYLKVVVPQLAFVALVAMIVANFYGDDSDDAPAHGFGRAVAIVSTVITILSIAEWIVVAFSREHHDHLSFRAAVLSGVPHEAPDAPPRVRLDVPWIWTKGKRKVRSLLLIGVGLPIFALFELVPRGGHWVSAAAGLLWSFYWVAVFALANSSLAWQPPLSPKEPFFLRGLGKLARVPVLGAIVRLYVRVARRISGSVHHACQAFEDDAPWEAIGLAAVRFVFGLPGLYLLSRPIFPVAATHALVARRYPADEASGAPFRQAPPPSFADGNIPPPPVRIADGPDAPPPQSTVDARSDRRGA